MRMKKKVYNFIMGKRGAGRTAALKRKVKLVDIDNRLIALEHEVIYLREDIQCLTDCINNLIKISGIEDKKND